MFITDWNYNVSEHWWCMTLKELIRLVQVVNFDIIPQKLIFCIKSVRWTEKQKDVDHYWILIYKTLIVCYIVYLNVIWPKFVNQNIAADPGISKCYVNDKSTLWHGNFSFFQPSEIKKKKKVANNPPQHLILSGTHWN